MLQSSSCRVKVKVNKNEKNKWKKFCKCQLKLEKEKLIINAMTREILEYSLKFVPIVKSLYTV